ncbi:MAG: hypothetical protein QGG42_01005 [Phycisphaerae bacterium]|jgi:hypothetical protein|nr:hypothetical protein [Phycisphaerae bacterium]
MNWKTTRRLTARITFVILLAGPLSCRETGPDLGYKDSLITINIIDNAIRMYHAEHRRYPGKDLFRDLTGSGDDDGKPGYGYRLEPRGTVYGPWNGVHRLSTKGDPPRFADAYGNEIEYHPFEGMSEDVKDYMTKSSAPGREPVYYRRDYILRSRGPNGKWDPPRNPDSDDITNFARE